MPRTKVVTEWLRARPDGDSRDPRAVADHPASVSVSRAVQAGNQKLSDDVLRLVFDHSPIGIAVSGLDGRWLWLNDSCRQMLGYDDKLLLGAATDDVTETDEVLVDREFLTAALAGECERSAHDKRYVRSDESVLWARVLSQLIRDDSGQPLYFISHVQDVSERRHAQDLLHGSERTLRAMIDNTPAMISVKDRDHRYTLVNREFEQRHGMSGSRIIGLSDSELVPAESIDDVHARDLAVLDTGESSEEECLSVTDGRERLLLISRFPLRDEAGVIHGVCTASTDITERRIEEHSMRERLECSELIYSALAERRFVLYGQPILRLASMECAASELLIRMRKPSSASGLMAPPAFLPAAERFDLVGLIDDWVVDQAIALAASGHRVGVNLSAKTVSNRREVSRIERRLEASAAAPENLIFEVTETAVASDLDAARDFAIRMRSHGCAIALDDFGVGHGTFTYLRHLPVDYLKIDTQFVQDLRSNDEDRQVVQAIVGVAHQFKIETIAEGVEDQATLVAAGELGVDYVQGYLTGHPMPLEECWAFNAKPGSGDTDAEAE